MYIITAFAYLIFGTNESATMFFPMIFSICNILLTYHITKLITHSGSIALIAASLMTLLPTDVTFASINMTDSAAALLINLGIYLLYLAHQHESLRFAILSGICFALSIFFKIYVFYTSILLLILFLYIWQKTGRINQHIIWVLAFIGMTLLIEGIIYSNLNYSFFYRFQQTELNYLYGKHDFFVEGSKYGYSSDGEYLSELFKLVFLYNPKSIFLRRFYLFLPLIALIQSFILIKKRKYIILSLWYLGLAILFIFFTTSFQTYRPQVLRLSWYIYPLFMPAVILSAVFLSALKIKIRNVILVIFFCGSLIMCNSYRDYFQIKELNQFKNIIRNSPEKIIYTDHFTKYSIDLIDEYEIPLRTRRISGTDFKWSAIHRGDWIVYNREHVTELSNQKHSFPDFMILNEAIFKKLYHIENFEIYEKLSESIPQGRLN
jgi:4-amino-4-deoxy-L-arabinose transferase-like glycosyltransferase